MIEQFALPKAVTKLLKNGVSSLHNLSLSINHLHTLLLMLKVMNSSTNRLTLQAFLGEVVSLTFTPRKLLSTLKNQVRSLDIPTKPKILYGVVNRCKLLAYRGGEYRYTITLVPKLALLAQNRRSAIYQHQSGVVIVESILREHHFTGIHYRLELKETYPNRPFTTQWQESDLAFIQRILADSGIWSCFESSAKHRYAVMVLCDSAEQTITPLNDMEDSGATSVWDIATEVYVTTALV